jgi:hypothetical protein
VSFLDDEVARLKSAGANFSRAYDTFVANRERAMKTPATAAEWNRLNSYAATVKKYVTLATSTTDAIVNWLSNTFGGGVAGLGILPVIPALGWIAISTAVTAMTYFITGAYELNRTLDYQQSTGKIPVTPVTVAGAVSNLALYGFLGVLAVLIIPRLFKGK